MDESERQQWLNDLKQACIDVVTKPAPFETPEEKRARLEWLTDFAREFRLGMPSNQFGATKPPGAWRYTKFNQRRMIR